MGGGGILSALAKLEKRRKVMKKRVLSAILSFCMLIGMVALIPVSAADSTADVWDGSVASAFAGGDGTAASPYQIATGAQLAYLAQCVNAGTADNAYASAHYQLTADIDLGGKGWAPIGSGDYDNNIFKGTFDGNGKTIKNLVWDGVSYGQPTSTSGIGLFGVIGGNVCIKDLALTGVNLESSNDATGALAGYWKADNEACNGTIENVYVSGTVKGGATASGFIAQPANIGGTTDRTMTFKDCVFDGTVTVAVGTSKKDYAGGFVGNGNNCVMSFTDCLNLGAISGSQYVAGLVGRQDVKATFTNCINLGKITPASGKIAGEITSAGKNKNAPITFTSVYGLEGGYADFAKNVKDSTTADKRVAAEDLAGVAPALTDEGFASWTKRENDIMIPSGVESFGIKYLTKVVKISWVVDDVVVKTEDVRWGTVPAYDGETPTKAEDENFSYTFSEWSPAIGEVTADTTYTAVFSKVSKGGWDSVAATSFAGGEGTEASPYQIATAEQLAYFAQCVNTEPATYASLCYVLTADIDLGGRGWTPIGSGNYDQNVFTGTFDGKGHKISNMTWDGVSYGKPEDTTGIGLFGVIGANVTVKDLVIENAKIEKGVKAIGLLAGYWKAGVPNATANIRNIYVSGTLTASGDNLGGLIGQLSGAQDGAKIIIESCVSDCNITGGGTNAGGMIGNGNAIYAEISDCLNIGNITCPTDPSGHYYVAGIIGRQDQKSVINNCINVGKLVAKSYREISNSSVTNFNDMVKNVPMEANNCFGLNSRLGKHTLIDGEQTDNGTAVTLESLKGLDATLPNDTFTKWTKRENDIMVPTGVAAFAPATYNVDTKYTISWEVEGQIVKTTEVKKGDMPSFGDETPTKADDDKYTYTFNGWSPELQYAREDITYTAEFFRTRKTSAGDPSSSETTPPEPENPTTTETTTEAEDKKGGCKSAMGGSVIALVMIVGAAAVTFGKKKED